MGDTVVLVSESGCVLRYPLSFGSILVERPYGSMAQSSGCMTASAEPEADDLQPAVTSTPICKPMRKRKRKNVHRELNEGERLQRKYHLEVKEYLLECHTSLVTAAKTCGYLPAQTQSSITATKVFVNLTGFCNTITSILRRSCVQNGGIMTSAIHTLTECDIDLTSLCDLDALIPLTENTETFLLPEDYVCTSLDVFGRLVSNTSMTSRVITTLGRQFLVPACSTFLLSDFDKMATVFKCKDFLHKYNLIVIDPPWENRSTIRSRRYHWLPMHRFIEIPISCLAAEGALVVVWVTNKRKFVQFVLDTLFPAWGVTVVAEWHWIKVTTEGELVVDMDSSHKKPYEIIIIGKRTCSSSKEKQLCHCSQADATDEEMSCSKRQRVETKKMDSPIPYQNCIMCIPSNIHSQKPYLGDLLSGYLPDHKHCLELFARNLLPQWTSWGNEVLKFQQLSEI